MVICHCTLLIIFSGTGVCLNKMNTSLSTVSGETNLCSHLQKHRRWQSGLASENEMNRNEGCQQDHCVRGDMRTNMDGVLPATWTRSAVVTFLGLGPILKVNAGPKTLQKNRKERAKWAVVFNWTVWHFGESAYLLCCWDTNLSTKPETKVWQLNFALTLETDTFFSCLSHTLLTEYIRLFWSVQLSTQAA